MEIIKAVIRIRMTEDRIMTGVCINLKESVIAGFISKLLYGERHGKELFASWEADNRMTDVRSSH